MSPPQLNSSQPRTPIHHLPTVLSVLRRLQALLGSVQILLRFLTIHSTLLNPRILTPILLRFNLIHCGLSPVWCSLLESWIGGWIWGWREILFRDIDFQKMIFSTNTFIFKISLNPTLNPIFNPIISLIRMVKIWRRWLLGLMCIFSHPQPSPLSHPQNYWLDLRFFCLCGNR